ncbi:CZB domain-containing protein [Vibrio sinaloensis]|nr:CZB domain-containing protein [Vibrio sinaloensis]
MSTSSAQIGSIVNEVVVKSEHMKQVIHVASTRAFLDTVKLDHALWKKTISTDCCKNGQFTETVNSHSECRLGQWYYRGDGQAFNHLRSFSMIEEPHKGVHESGRRAMNQANVGNMDAMASSINAMEDASERVVVQIDHLMDEIIASPSKD